MTAPDRPPRARLPLSYWVVAVGLPLIVGAVAVAVQLAWLPELPDPIAIHWGGDGVDGFAPAWFSTVLSAGLSLGMTALFAVILGTARGSAGAPTLKLLVVTSLATSVLLGVLMTASVGIQRGLDDASEAPAIDGWLGIAFAGALLAGAVSWFALPRAKAPLADAAHVEPLRLVAGERSAWIAGTRLSTGAIVVVLTGVGVALAATVFAVIATEGRTWPLLAIPVFVLALCALGVSWRARVDARGLTVSSRPFGWPRVRIAASEIAEVQTSHVEPLAEFGGWGWRWAPGRSFGVVTRSGEAIEVRRRDGRRFTVTVDDAATGAALLAAYAASATEIRERGPQTGSARGNG